MKIPSKSGCVQVKTGKCFLRPLRRDKPRPSGMDARHGWRKCGKRLGTCAACRNPEARDGFHADWMPSFPDGMTLNTISKSRYISKLKHGFQPNSF